MEILGFFLSNTEFAVESGEAVLALARVAVDHVRAGPAVPAGIAGALVDIWKVGAQKGKAVCLVVVFFQADFNCRRVLAEDPPDARGGLRYPPGRGAPRRPF